MIVEEISLEDARTMDSKYELGDIVQMSRSNPNHSDVSQRRMQRI